MTVKRLFKTLVVSVPALAMVIAIKLIRRPKPAYLKFAKDSKELYIAKEYDI
jgi:hypothetical protein